MRSLRTRRPRYQSTVPTADADGPEPSGRDPEIRLLRADEATRAAFNDIGDWVSARIVSTARVSPAQFADLTRAAQSRFAAVLPAEMIREVVAAAIRQQTALRQQPPDLCRVEAKAGAPRRSAVSSTPQ